MTAGIGSWYVGLLSKPALQRNGVKAKDQDSSGCSNVVINKSVILLTLYNRYSKQLANSVIPMSALVKSITCKKMMVN